MQIVLRGDDNSAKVFVDGAYVADAHNCDQGRFVIVPHQGTTLARDLDRCYPASTLEGLAHSIDELCQHDGIVILPDDGTPVPSFARSIHIPLVEGGKYVFRKPGKHGDEPWAHYWDEEDGGEGGELWIANGRVEDYDGCYELPEHVKAELRLAGIEMEEAAA